MDHRREYDLKVIGANLRRMRKAKGFSIRYVAQYLMYSTVQAVYRIERGVGYPHPDTLLALMELYDAGVADLVDEPNSDDNGE